MNSVANTLEHQESPQAQQQSSLVKILLGLCLLMIGVAVLSLPIGAPEGIGLSHAIEGIQYALLYAPPTELSQGILHYLLLPRTGMALLAGAMMALSGVLIQQSLQNPYASPTTLGINAGGMVLTLLGGLFFPQFLHDWPVLVAFVGALATAMLVWRLSKWISDSPLNLILVGMAMGLALGSLSAGLMMVGENRLDGFFIWGAGNLAQNDGQLFQRLLPIGMTLVVVSLLLTRQLDMFDLGDTQAQAAGLSVEKTRLIALLVAILLSASVVSMAGMIGFIGLVAPHLAAYLIKGRSQNRTLWRALLALPLGAMMLLLADLISRSFESQLLMLPAGAFTALIGAPFLMMMLRKPQHQYGQLYEKTEVGIRAVIRFKPAIVFSVIFTLSVVILVQRGMEGQWELSRALIAFGAGAALAISGLILQTLLRNPLASPDVSGISSAGVLAVVVTTAFIPMSREMMALVSLLGSSGLLVLAWLWAKGGKVTPQGFALAGICLAAFGSTCVNLILTLSPSQSSEALMWLSGTLYGVDDRYISWIWGPLLLGLPLLLLASRWLNLLYLGVTWSSILGLPVRTAIYLLIAITAVFTSLSIATVGGIAFVGLVAPHVIRAIGVANYQWLLPSSAMFGGLLLLLSDWLSMSIYPPFELPAGIVVSILGGIYFVVLLLSGRYLRG
ncbi:iron ABC transporter permease [Litoribrevibacter albus]|uniref:Fe3+-hydroxamate ABC transporter permease FhuB n=1 Tax=Litoribrevibacter albus TaxID=1473156 RepID=A0AA37SEA8_9GAMM|nr:iron ABC transporter permease [Litoribrevibacter albus]GLQ32732.1 Fe3+-hydroxamate ABC transporter permease FhuB [Litoribrevibacter albus]